MGIIDLRSYSAIPTEEEITADNARWRTMDEQIEAHLLEALTIAEEHFGSGTYAFDYVGAAFQHCEITYRNATRQPRPRRRLRMPGAILRRQVYERDQYRCVSCGTHLELTIDHIIPYSKGGETTLENLQTMCRTCNVRKKDKV